MDFFLQKLQGPPIYIDKQKKRFVRLPSGKAPDMKEPLKRGAPAGDSVAESSADRPYNALSRASPAADSAYGFHQSPKVEERPIVNDVPSKAPSRASDKSFQSRRLQVSQAPSLKHTSSEVESQTKGPWVLRQNPLKTPGADKTPNPNGFSRHSRVQDPTPSSSRAGSQSKKGPIYSGRISTGQPLLSKNRRQANLRPEDAYATYSNRSRDDSPSDV